MTDLIGHLEMLDMLVRHPDTRAGTEAGAAFNLIKLGCHNPRQSERERERERESVLLWIMKTDCVAAKAEELQLIEMFLSG